MWRSTELGKLLQRSENWIQPDPTELYQQVTIKMWGQGVILRQQISGNNIKAKRQLGVKPGQFILSRIDARHGAFGIVPEHLDGALVSNDFPAFDINTPKLLPGFLNWMSKTASFIELCRAASEGTTNRVRLKEEKFLETKIPLPELDEQRRIVARIEELAAKVEEARELRSLTQKHLQSFVSSFHLHLASDRNRTLDQILQLDEDRQEVIFGNEYPQVGVRGFGGGLFFRETLDATQTTYKAFNRLYEGAIVLSQVKGWEGAIAGCPDNLVGKYVSPKYRTFRCIEGEALPEYMATLVTSPWFWTQLKNLTRGMGGRRERTRPEKFLEMKIPMPTAIQQKRALQAFRQLDALRTLQTQTATELDALLPAILDKAFKGQL